MDEKQLKLALGSLLHDVGKILHRSVDGRNHSESGYDFLKEMASKFNISSDETSLLDEEVLEQVRCHHADMIKKYQLNPKSLAYITYMADNIAAASTGQDNENGEDDAIGNGRLKSIFSILNKTTLDKKASPKFYPAQKLDPTNIPYPVDEADSDSYDNAVYQEIRSKLQEHLKKMCLEKSDIHSLIELLEETCSFIPSPARERGMTDISLFDHAKLTAAIANCIYPYLEEQKVQDYHKELVENREEFYKKPVFLLFEMGFSGIQDFIYNQHTKDDALKNLRARSFYLEIMMENLVDELLEKSCLTRANVIYTGGGHSHLLLSNTEDIQKELEQFKKDTKAWFLEIFSTDLFCAMGYKECSANDLINGNIPTEEIVVQIAEQKLAKYDVKEIIELNKRSYREKERECKICHRRDLLQKTEDDNKTEYICRICDGMNRLSSAIQKQKLFFISENSSEGILPIYKDRFLGTNLQVQQLCNRKIDSDILRVYYKNKKNEMEIGNLSSKTLWVGDYSGHNTLAELADAGEGIERLGVLRADVDNLGQAFISGFSGHNRSFSRNAALSRSLGIFFKLYINTILKNPGYRLNGIGPYTPKRNVSIIYSGGDDVFVVGAWKDVLEFAIDLEENFQHYTDGKLSISAGFGMYKAGYPISYIADAVGDLESRSKEMDEKNGITLFDTSHTYHWDVLKTKVLGEKYQVIQQFLENTKDKGKSFLYDLLELFRNRGERIHLARLAYTLARIEPKEKKEDDAKELQTLKEKIYQWMMDEHETKQAITAIMIYNYIIRNEEDKDE